MSTQPPLPTNFDEVLARLDQITDWAIENSSPIGYFTAIYRGVTSTIKQQVAERRFQDNERMERFDAVFAGRYIEAFDRWQSNSGPSKAWQVSFDASHQKHLAILQHLLPAVNAHMNLDLGVAAATIAPPGDVEGLKPDFDLINKILSELVDHDRVAVEAVSPTLKTVDRFGKLSDKVVEADIDLRREQSWKVTVDLATATPQGRSQKIAALDQSVANQSGHVIKPPLLIRLAFRGLVAPFEPRDPAVVIRALADSAST